MQYTASAAPAETNGIFFLKQSVFFKLFFFFFKWFEALKSQHQMDYFNNYNLSLNFCCERGYALYNHIHEGLKHWLSLWAILTLCGLRQHENKTEIFFNFFKDQIHPTELKTIIDAPPPPKKN